MEGKDDEFMFFEQSVADLMEAFPFYNSFCFQEEDDPFNNFFNFPELEDFNQKMGGDQLLEKITKCEENYNNIFHNNILSSPTISKFLLNLDVKDKITESFESNLTLAKGTLPGLIISIMHRENCPLSHNYLLNEIYPNFEELTKINGTKYNVS